MISLQTKRKFLSSVISKIKALNLPPRVMIIVKPISNNNAAFYINLLRNIAILSIRTTHFLVLDMDMWPNCTVILAPHDPVNSYQELASLPPSILNSERAAVILPCVFIQKFNSILSNCTSLLDCAIAYGWG